MKKKDKQTNQGGDRTPSPKSSKGKTNKAKPVLSDDEFVCDLGYFFRNLPAFTFVADFPDREWTDELPLGPTLISAFDLLVCARQGSTYCGPYVDGERKVAFGGIDFAAALKRRREIVGEVKSRIAELRQRGIKFAICWCAYGDEPDLDWSGEGDEDELDVYQRLSEHPKELFDMLVE